MPGFIGHGDRDPDRRTDPGHAFPWAEFFQTIDDLLGGDPMSDYAPQINDIQQTVKKVSEDLSEALSTLRKIHRQNGVVRSKVTRLIRQHRNDEPVTMDDLEGLLDLLAEEDDEEAEALDGGTP